MKSFKHFQPLSSQPRNEGGFCREEEAKTPDLKLLLQVLMA